MTAIIIFIVGVGLYYFLHEKFDNRSIHHRRKKPILSGWNNQSNLVIFFSGYVVVGIFILWFEIDYKSLEVIGIAIPLNFVWWWLCLDGRKEMVERENKEKELLKFKNLKYDIKELKKNNPEEWKKLNE